MKLRRRARIVALQALYEIDSVNHNPSTVLQARLATQPLPPEGEAFARSLLEGVLAHLPQLDEMIHTYAPEWPLDQMAVIDRNILRMAIYEFAISGETPVKVAINEAVELAKIFGSNSSRRFVNGVLGTLAAQIPLPSRKAAERAKSKRS
ncbi:MAG: transcription antitermination factor NusB [Anaerolineae bacterium]|nr:transcription antitermination factor NusB [Anaerolineae bacterium]